MTAAQNPFGHSISTEDIIDTLGFFDAWDDRYKYIIDLGKELPPLDEEFHTEDRLVRGCQSQVWIETWLEDGKIQLAVDSDAFIVKGLIAVLLEICSGQKAQAISETDIAQVFTRLQLQDHLSPSRSNGFYAMIERIKTLASAGSGL